MESADGTDGEGFLEGIDADVGDAGGLPWDGLVSVVDQNFDEPKRENPLESLLNASRVGAVDADRKHLGFLFSSDLVRESRESPYTRLGISNRNWNWRKKKKMKNGIEDGWVPRSRARMATV